MSQPGQRNLITDVPGIRVGNAEDATARTGTTVVLTDAPMVAAADVRGGAPGTREIDLLDPTCLVERIDAICLGGGSVMGLAAADGVVSWLARHGRGHDTGIVRVPIVPAAIIFDYRVGGTRDWGDEPPYRRLGMSAAENAGEAFMLGNSGAGMGATAGPLKGGLGSASEAFSDGLIVGALAIANPVGAAVMPGTKTFWAWPFERDNELGGQRPPAAPPEAGDLAIPPARPGENTTLGVIATNARLDTAQARRVAMMAHDGMARAIVPSHTPFDGDIVFALASGERSQSVDPAELSRIGAAAANCLARAIARGVYEADDLGAYRGYRT